MSSPVTRAIPPPSKKGRKGRRNRLKGAPGRGTLEKEKPPILGMIQRGDQVVLKMLANVRQTTIKPIIEAGVAQRCSTLFIESLEQHGRGILSYG